MKKIFIVMILLTGTLLVGCEKDDKNIGNQNNTDNQITEEAKDNSSEEDKDKNEENINQDSENNKDKNKENVDLDNESENLKDNQSDKEKIETDKGKQISVDLYLYDVVKDKWIKEKSEVDANRIKDIVINIRNNTLSTFPKNTKVYSVTVKDKIATVDMGKEFLDPNSETSAASNGKIYSIVNTLCLNKELGIDGVMFLIEGKQVDIIGQSDGKMIFKPTKME